MSAEIVDQLKQLQEQVTKIQQAQQSLSTIPASTNAGNTTRTVQLTTGDGPVTVTTQQPKQEYTNGRSVGLWLDVEAWGRLPPQWVDDMDAAILNIIDHLHPCISGVSIKHTWETIIFALRTQIQCMAELNIAREKREIKSLSTFKGLVENFWLDMANTPKGKEVLHGGRHFAFIQLPAGLKKSMEDIWTENEKEEKKRLTANKRERSISPYRSDRRNDRRDRRSSRRY